jgi:hypothetical protein
MSVYVDLADFAPDFLDLGLRVGFCVGFGVEVESYVGRSVGSLMVGFFVGFGVEVGFFVGVEVELQ